MTDYEPSQDALDRGRNLAVDRVTLEVLGALQELGREAILLKGPAHARWLYEPEHHRSYSDTDLLVAPDAVAGVEEVLARAGFELPDIYSDDDRPGYEHAWVRRRDGVRVDLHWNLVGSTVDDATAWSVLSAARSTMDLHGTTVTVLSLEGRALHVALHAAQHGSELGTAIDDLTRAVSKDKSIWAGALELAEAIGAVASLSAGLRLDDRGAVIADSLHLPAEMPVDVSLRAAAAPGHALSLQWFLSQKGVVRKARLILGNLFPSRSFMREWSPLAKRGVLGLALAYLWRPFHLVACFAAAAPTLRAVRRDAERAATDAESEENPKIDEL